MHENGVTAIKLKATRNPVKVLAVVVNFENGRRQMLNRLEGKILDGKAKTVKFDGRRAIRSITISAVSTSAYGSRGELSVLIGKKSR